MTKPSEPFGEFGAIAAYFAPLAGPEGLGLRDDAALYTPPPGQSLVMTKDAMVAGIHFFPDDDPALVGQKLARSNLSDLAAMGASPAGYLLAVALPKTQVRIWMQGIAQGLAAVQDEFHWTLWGGDTVTTSGPVTVSLTAIGHVPTGAALHRSGAKAGDRVFVSGTIGDAAFGLLIRQGEGFDLPEPERNDLLDRLYKPTPRVVLGQRLQGLAHAAQDVSDGLIADLSHLARASGLEAHLRLKDIPLSAAVKTLVTTAPDRFETIFAGDDYELIFTVAPENVPELLERSRGAGVQITEIGEMVPLSAVDAAPVTLFDDQGDVYISERSGYIHF